MPASAPGGRDQRAFRHDLNQDPCRVNPRSRKIPTVPRRSSTAIAISASRNTALPTMVTIAMARWKRSTTTKVVVRSSGALVGRAAIVGSRSLTSRENAAASSDRPERDVDRRDRVRGRRVGWVRSSRPGGLADAAGPRVASGRTATDREWVRRSRQSGIRWLWRPIDPAESFTASPRCEVRGSPRAAARRESTVAGPLAVEQRRSRWRQAAQEKATTASLPGGARQVRRQGHEEGGADGDGRLDADRATDRGYTFRRDRQAQAGSANTELGVASDVRPDETLEDRR